MSEFATCMTDNNEEEKTMLNQNERLVKENEQQGRDLKRAYRSVERSYLEGLEKDKLISELW